MQSDLPHTLYGKHGQKKGTVVTDDVVQKQLEANRRARERHARKKGVTLDELFKKDND
jgi:hypothetical protein|nr:MAG TPA: methyl-CpG binding protein-like protein [Caudoviricetes sp.]DAI74993.1 MAG TPA: methyl-CpG binding protein-like protein [Bacteriophage sp.]